MHAPLAGEDRAEHPVPCAPSDHGGNQDHRPYRLRARLHHGPQSHQVIALSATRQILLAVVTFLVLAGGGRVMPSTGLRSAGPGPTWPLFHVPDKELLRPDTMTNKRHA